MRRDAFRYAEDDRFPLDQDVSRSVRLQPDGADNTDEVTFLAARTVEAAAERVADEIARLLSEGAVVRDPRTGVARPARAADIAILFRSRDSHRDYEAALDRRHVPTYVYKGLGFFEADEIQDARGAAAVSRRSGLGPARRGVSPLALRPGLGPGRRPARTPPGERAGRSAPLRRRSAGSTMKIAGCSSACGSALPRWLAMVDRVTPSELLDEILRETAYAFEMRGPRRPQARENLKKLRALIRRVENRGYATLARIADFLDDLAVGDESNAVIDALDAVSLMTVHAAKGLEFPIVFVVNMQRGTGGPRAPIRVLADGYGTPSVSIGDFESEADEDATAREREETKRLLYVALTRARDRLYLAAALKDGAFKPGRGSLGEVLPRGVAARFEAALGKLAGLKACTTSEF